MKDAARILYKIGKVFSIISIIVCAVMIVLSVLGLIMKDDLFQSLVDQGNTDITSVEQLVGVLITLMIAMAFALIVEIVRLKFVGRAIASLGTPDKVPHIVLLVLAVVDTGIFYLIASVMGLVLACKAPDTTPSALAQNDTNTTE